jgi:hypothetical protein
LEIKMAKLTAAQRSAAARKAWDTRGRKKTTEKGTKKKKLTKAERSAIAKKAAKTRKSK